MIGLTIQTNTRFLSRRERSGQDLSSQLEQKSSDGVFVDS